MIKRLKWNVLYGGGGGIESDGGLSSSSEEEAADDKELAARQAQANEILQELVEQDPEMAETLHAKLQAMQDFSDEDDEDDSDGEEEGIEMRARGARQQGSGKRKGRGVDRHDSSSSDEEDIKLGEKEGAAGNGNAVSSIGDGEVKVAQYERRQTRDDGTGAHSPLEVSSHKRSEDSIPKAEKRKLKAKRKLRLLKMKKWRKMQASKSEDPNVEESGVNVETRDQRSGAPAGNDCNELAISKSASKHRSDQTSAHSEQKETRSENSSCEREKVSEIRSTPCDLERTVGDRISQEREVESKQRKADDNSNVKSGPEQVASDPGKEQDATEGCAEGRRSECCDKNTVSSSPTWPFNKAGKLGKRALINVASLERKARGKKAKTRGPTAAPG